MTDVRAELLARVDAAVAAGVDPAQLVLDPGLGLRQDGGAQLGAARPTGRARRLGLPVLVGSSRKSFLGRLLADARRHAAAGRRPRGRDHRAHRATARWHGAWGVRVHEVRPSVDAALAIAAIGAGARPMSRSDPAAGLRVRGHHGVFDFERRDGQDFVVDVVLETRRVDGGRFRRARRHRGLRRAGQQAGRGGRRSSRSTCSRRCAARLAEVCLADPRVQAATVTVHKPQAPIPLAFADVAVTMRRARP